MFEDISKVVLVTDMDGTLLNSKKEVTPKDRAAIERFMQLGGKFTVATGRTIQSFSAFYDLLDLRFPVIMFNGSIIYDKLSDSVLYSESLPESAREYTMQIMREMPDIGGEVLKTHETFVFSNNEYEKRHIEICKVIPVYSRLEDIKGDDWQKVLFAMAPEKIPELMELVSRKKYDGVCFVKSADIFFEMIKDGITKGSALKKYRELDEFKGYTFVAAGDYNNDIEMLIEADLGAAPANAQPEVKAAADIVLKNTCDEGAIAELIDIIIEKCKIG
ncbi:MAG: HAD family phosphatase [Ruminococcus sp.]|nr:HAD family phosphatase [Ruminococcus sp.]